jgi:hypothetical protein
MEINYGSSKKFMAPQPLFAVTHIVCELPTGLTQRGSVTSMRLLISENIDVHIPHVYYFPLDLLPEVL